MAGVPDLHPVGHKLWRRREEVATAAPVREREIKTAFAFNDERAPVVERYRTICACLVAASILVALLLDLISHVAVDPEGATIIAWVLAALLVTSLLWWNDDKEARIADLFGTVALVWCAGISCGAIAMLGLRIHLPLADNTLFAIDRAIGVDPLAITSWLLARGQWIFAIMAAAYNFTIPLLVLSIAALALTGRRLEAWRAAFCFIGSLSSICLIAIATPAKGVGLWAPASLLQRLPGRSMRYFWANFDAFYAGGRPVLRLSTIDGVISFPSFHAAMGFIVVAMWRKSPLTLAPAAAWLLFMLLATFPFGGHYAIDVIGGIAVAAVWFGLSNWIDRIVA
jgi:membrane-associated phospholipid phosphatase